ncbi:hypothetical protein UVI_02026350 [Ustilaginoidea virens]|uniref:RRM domain-containing protein n=1 Tax=Ustilaginoidea virens TaxID=1159556 RepID=A0A1B5L101_USTVR|nr:hypothetical protein UVI_02026350 [Ustilaginoidea virens]
MATAADQPAQPDGAHAAAASKRKTMDEIAVDLALPEPPSKRARRALKKGKQLPAKPSNSSGSREDDDDDDDGGGGGGGADKEKPDGRGKSRSEHGIWVGNLPFSVTAAELKQWLVDNSGGVITDAAITRIKLPTSKGPGAQKPTPAPANKGFAYVDFADLGAKVAAIALSETELAHRKLLIKDAKSFEGRPPKDEEPQARAVGPDGQPQRGPHSTNRTDPAPAAAAAVNASRKIFIGNMSFKTTQDDVHRTFEKCGEIEWVKVATFEDTGKCKGYGWVKFKEPEAAAWAVKGYVKIREAVDTEEDFNDEADDGGDGDGAAPGRQAGQKRFKTRKWWVNRMLGRELKLELAEDDQARYKKRFGKDARAHGGGERADGFSQGRHAKSKGGGGGGGGGGGAAATAKTGQLSAAAVEPTQSSRRQPGGDGTKGVHRAAETSLKQATSIQEARLMGTTVKHTGTKVTFD